MQKGGEFVNWDIVVVAKNKGQSVGPDGGGQWAERMMMYGCNVNKKVDCGRTRDPKSKVTRVTTTTKES